MTGHSRVNISRGVAAATISSVLLIGAGGTYLVMRDRAYLPGEKTSLEPGIARTPGEPPPSASTDRPDEPASDVVVSLTKEAVERAGIEVTPVSTQPATDALRLPGVVEPNAYRQVSVTSLVGGRVVRVSAQLGDRVRRGQTVAQVYSPELAEARTKYIAARAMLEAHDRALQRTQKLVEIGAASRQELERIHAEHAAQTAEVESARSRLQLLGAADLDETASSSRDAAATTNVPAPIDGVITERLANVGLNVDPATKLFTIVDLSSVWIIADVYENDLHRIREGAHATVTTKAYPDLSLEGRVTYIDPQLSTTTRTAKVRVEVANPRGDLRLGLYADVRVTTASTTSMLLVPRSAVQNVGGRQVVYVPMSNQPAKFTEREVHVGRSTGDLVEIVSGLENGEVVVSKGSFLVRAEAERLGLRASPQQPGADRQRTHVGGPPGLAMQTVKILVSDNGYEPARVSLRAGAPARLTFLRTSSKTCGTEVVFPSLNIKRPLPLNEPVAIEFTPSKAGEIAFACGMRMLHGTVVVE